MRIRGGTEPPENNDKNVLSQDDRVKMAEDELNQMTLEDLSDYEYLSWLYYPDL